jgi:hypothetical protein
MQLILGGSGGIQEVAPAGWGGVPQNSPHAYAGQPVIELPGLPHAYAGQIVPGTPQRVAQIATQQAAQQAAQPVIELPGLPHAYAGQLSSGSTSISSQVVIPAQSITINTPQSAAIFPSNFSAVNQTASQPHTLTPARFNANPSGVITTTAQQSKPMNNFQVIMAKIQAAFGGG